jgi:hypothetical protein
MRTFSEDQKVEPMNLPLFRAGKGNRPQRICIWRRYEVEEFEAYKNTSEPRLPDCGNHEHMSEDKVFLEIMLAPLYRKAGKKEGEERFHWEAQWLVDPHPVHNSPYPQIRKEYARLRAQYGDQCSILIMNEVMEMVIRKSAGFDVHQLVRY